MATPHATGVRGEDLQPLLDGRYASLRRQIRDVLSRPEFEAPSAIATAEYRELVFGWMKMIAAEGLTAPGFPIEYGGHGDAGANIAGFETIAYGDLSLLVKFGVQFGLWGGAIHRLGTRGRHQRYLRGTS
jgi:acyl-CoA oxidase